MSNKNPIPLELATYDDIAEELRNRSLPFLLVVQFGHDYKLEAEWLTNIFTLYIIEHLVRGLITASDAEEI